jgi:hypothetical protein
MLITGGEIRDRESDRADRKLLSKQKRTSSSLSQAFREKPPSPSLPTIMRTIMTVTISPSHKHSHCSQPNELLWI